jgi:hypothetical protein
VSGNADRRRTKRDAQGSRRAGAALQDIDELNVPSFLLDGELPQDVASEVVVV